MKKQRQYFTALIVFFFTIFSISCTKEIYTPWEKDITKNGIRFTKFRQALFGDSTFIGLLEDNTIINGYPCAKGWVHFSKHMVPIHFKVYDTLSVSRQHVPSKSYIILKPDSSFRIIFPKKFNVDGYEIKGGGGFNGQETGFYASGNLAWFFPIKNTLIDSIPCKGGILYGVWLYPNGKLKRCTIASETTIDGKTLSRGEDVYFKESGELYSGNSE